MRSARGVSSLPCCSAASAVLAFLAALGMHALLYFNWLTRQWERVRLLLVALSHRRLVARLRRDRRALIRMFEASVREYRAATGRGT